MKQLILALAGLALIASADMASAKTLHHRVHGVTRGDLVQRNVGLQGGSGYHANADLRYGPQPDYPQSLPEGGGH
ncbi:MAG TPA: hypothetical protein VK438_01040 [Xanthobacteraceae bacterium]|nr:hypothetical protein [Xanthobacteraceae bacterium]